MLTRPAIHIILFLAITSSSIAQHPVSGVILNDKTGAPIPYVSVAVIGQALGTVSNQNGAFSMDIPEHMIADSIGFYCVGYETQIIPTSKPSVDLVIRMEEKVINLEEVAITARKMKGETLVSLALENKNQNYPAFLENRMVFKRRNAATFIDRFDLQLNKSTLPEIDDTFVKSLEDSIIRYNRTYSDYLYRLYNSPDDSLHTPGKIQGIKRIELNEEIGGEMEQIEQQLNHIFDNREKGVFWKLKTGPISAKLDDSDEEPSTDPEPVEQKADYQARVDSIITLGYRKLYDFDQQPWKLEFLDKPERYSWKTQGILPIRGERCYVVVFKGGLGKDYTGRVYISEDSYAILRIEYELKTRKAAHGIKLLGITYNEPEDSGIVLFERDENGYYLKYSMQSTTQIFAIDRSFKLIQKKDNPLFNKRTQTIDFAVDIFGRDERSDEVLVISREALSADDFRNLESSPIKTDKITSYSDELWKGYSILEPTMQMKEYRARVK